MNPIEFIKNLHINLIYIIVAIIGLVGLFASIFLKRWFTQKDTKKILEAEKNAIVERELSGARKEFIHAFDNAIQRLNNPKGQHANGILSETMPSHKVAFNKFRSIVVRLKGKAISGLDKVWNEYYDTETYGKNPFAKYYTGSQNTQKDKKSAIDKIQAICDFVNKL